MNFDGEDYSQNIISNTVLLPPGGGGTYVRDRAMKVMFQEGRVIAKVDGAIARARM